MLLIAGALAAVTAHAGPARAQDVTETDATLRFVHASPGAPNVDVLVDGQAVVQDLAFAAVTDYFALPGGTHTLQVVPTGEGADAALIETDLDAEDGKAYIFVALGRLNEIEGKVYEVNVDAVDAGKARVRVIHASPDAGTIAVAQSGGDELFGGIDFTDATDHKDLDAGTYSLDVKGDDDRVLLAGQTLDFVAGSVYDVVVLGQLADQSLALVPLSTAVSVPCAEVLGIAGNADDACLRLVHAAPGASAIDVYVNDSPVATGVTFGTATEFLALPAGDDRKVQVTASGKPPGDDDLLDADVDLEGRGAYEVVVAGNPDDLQATTAKLDLSPLPGGQARVRVVHASPDAGGIDVAVAEGQTLFEGVDFRDVTDATTIDAGTYALQVKQDDTVLLAGDATFEAGMVYDVVVIGRTDDTSLALLVLAAQASVREGAVASPQSQGTATAGTAESTVVDATVAPGDATIVPTAAAVEPTPTSS
jgi:hypothetical protein